jgi:hypothetical protein
MDFGAIPHMHSWNPQSHLVWTMTHTMLLLTSRLPGTGEHEPLPLPLPRDTLLSSLPSFIAVRKGSFLQKWRYVDSFRNAFYIPLQH